MHRSHFDWEKAELRHQNGTVEQRIFTPLKKMIALRKELSAFADFDNRHLLTLDNPNLLAFSRTDPLNSRNKVLVIGNFNFEAQTFKLSELKQQGFFMHESMKDLYSGLNLQAENDNLTIPPLSFYWLID
jgi:amylosucrase